MISPKRRRFISEYLKDQNASQAAIRSGYSKKNANVVGPRVLAKVRKEVDKRLEEIAGKVGIDKEYWLACVKEVSERCLQRVPVMMRDPRDGRKWVQKTDEHGEGVWEFDSTGANGSLRMIGQYLGLLAEKHIHSGTVTLAQILDGTWEKPA